MPDRQLPCAPEAEASLLGTMMVYSNAARTAIEEGLTEDDFYIERNRRIYSVCFNLYQQGMNIDLTTVATALNDMQELDRIGGFAYLTSLTDAAVTSANTKNYITLIHDRSVLRKLILTSEKIAADAMSGGVEVNDYLDVAEKEILNISRNRRTSEFKASPELMNSVLDQIRRMADNSSDVTGIKTGFRDLDHITHGFQRGDLIICAARPSMGKTAVSLNLALNIAQYQPKEAVAIFSLEMSAEQLAMRLLTAKSRVQGDKLKTGQFTDAEEWNRVNEAAGVLKTLKIFIDDTPGTKVADIFSKCRKLQADHGLSLVLIDYIQLIVGSGTGGQVSRQQEVSDISRSLKALARELKVPVIALSQLSRNVEAREVKKPMLSDLRESGAIEQDADVVMLLYRDSYYNEEAKELARQNGSEELEINVAKHRNGATRRINVAFEADTNALMNLDRRDVEE